MENGRNIKTDTCQPGSLKEVSQQMSFMENELARALELHDRVKMRLSCVLRSEPASELKPGAPTEEELTPLATEIRDYVQKLRHISYGYENMLECLEL